MIYGTNSLECTHEASGTTIRFDAFGALQGWLDEQAPPLEVASAQEWKESHDLTGKLVVAYDWTYTTKYEGDLLLNPKMLRSGGVDICQVSETASSDAHCQQATQPALWEVTEESIDRAALMRQEPILYFDEVNLYESELDDNGISRVNVKVRVMASSWYVLMRYWLRADGTLTRIRDTRIYCPFHATSKAMCDSSHVIREVTHREGNFEDLDPKRAVEARLNPDVGQQFLPITFQKVEKLRI
ncbi:hypothetical protein CYMTET_16816 [Cymbomonas tetramitiformis]|uniref:TIP41-like protein n=1 Tax=Cymbomonas tetramitiformis TaxID=36881 RepID=A0AAE0GB69_9CHLO|nr:hypothetical protein CYMTET_16816 [Cymbomonas tetramitiformis]